MLDKKISDQNGAISTLRAEVSVAIGYNARGRFRQLLAAGSNYQLSQVMINYLNILKLSYFSSLGEEGTLTFQQQQQVLCFVASFGSHLPLI